MKIIKKKHLITLQIYYYYKTNAFPAVFKNLDEKDYLIKQLIKISALKNNKEDKASLRILNQLLNEYKNVGTVIQTYLYRTETVIDKLRDIHLGSVKGAYKESEEVVYQYKETIDENY